MTEVGGSKIMRFFLVLYGLVFFANIAQAQEYKSIEPLGQIDYNQQAYSSAAIISIAGESCEEFSNAQSKSSVRVRVTDKASYNAVKNVDKLRDIDSQIPEHDINVIIYNLIDNFVHNLSVSTTKETNDELCVEVSGEILLSDIDEAIESASLSEPAPEYDFAKENGVEEININDITPKPSIEESKEVFYNPTAEVLSQEMIPADDKEEYIDTRANVYVAPVSFYNGASSAKQALVLKDFFADEAIYKFADTKENADYTLIPKVLKAKVDSINAKTKRMQMVVSLELVTDLSDASFTEHQNRFVLYEQGEDEQEVAKNLLKKLLQKAGDKISKRVDQQERKRQNEFFGNVLTPAK